MIRPIPHARRCTSDEPLVFRQPPQRKPRLPKPLAVAPINAWLRTLPRPTQEEMR